MYLAVAGAGSSSTQVPKQVPKQLSAICTQIWIYVDTHLKTYIYEASYILYLDAHFSYICTLQQQVQGTS